MWGRKEDQSNGPDMQLGPAQQNAPPRGAPPRPVAAPPKPAAPSRPADAAKSRMGQSIKFTGEIHSDEDFLVDGSVEGSISVPKYAVVIGPKSSVRATIEARSVLIHGQVKGKINATERVELAKTGRFEGDLITRRLEIHDGAVFVGTSAVHEPKQEPLPPATQAARPPEKRAEAAPKVPAAKPAPPNRVPDRVPAPAIPQRPIVKP